MDRDSLFDDDVITFLKATGLEPKQTSIRSPWQNGIAEKWVGSCRREILDHVIAISEGHLRRLVGDYLRYYHDDRIHDSLAKDTACPAWADCTIATRGAKLHKPFLPRVSTRVAFVGISKNCPWDADIAEKGFDEAGTAICRDHSQQIGRTKRAPLGDRNAEFDAVRGYVNAACPTEQNFGYRQGTVDARPVGAQLNALCG